jgi:hypothetical protein
MKKYIVLVAGYDYANGGVNFSYLAEERRLHLLTQNPAWQNDSDVVFVRLDVKAGKIERNTANGASRSWQLESGGFQPINRSIHYQSEHFIPADTHVMSIQDAYSYIMNIGNTEPGSVQEFSLLGHGWFGGPIMVNSFQRSEFDAGGVRASERDPWDKDARTKDFFPQNMADPDWDDFKKAFAADGYCWVWGCLFARAYYNTLYKVMETTAFRSKAFGSHADTDNFTISVNPGFVTSYYDADRTFFPTDNNERTFTRSLMDLKKFLKRGLKRSYPGRFTGDTGIACRAAYLGTYSDYELRYAGHNPAHTVMIIPRNTRAYGTDFTRTINFYRTYLSMPEDPENRGYGLYTSTLVSQWWTDTI